MVRMLGETLRKLVRVRPAEWIELMEAQVALLRAQHDVRTRPEGQLVASTASPRERPATSVHDAKADSLALAINRAAEYGVFRPLCLTRALALRELLRSHGIGGSQIRIGVRKNGESFHAHAWVEYRGHILGDTREHVGSFAQLSDTQVLDGQ